MKRILSLVLSLLLIVGVFSGCSPKNPDLNQSESKKSFTVVDQKGREVTFDHIPKKIVSLAPNITEILFDLNLGDRVVGVTKYCNYPKEAKSKPVMGTFESPDVEKIIAAKPEVVFCSALNKELVDQLEQAGIKVVVIDPKNIDQIFDAISLVGKISNTQKKSDQVVKDLQDELKGIEDKVKNIPKEERPVVYYEVWHEPIMTAGPNTFINYIIKSAGGVNLSEDAEADWPNYSVEKIIQKNPDFIILGHSGQTAEQVMKRPGWEKVNAVGNQHIKEMNPDIFSRPGPRVVEAVKLLAKYIHPNLFE